MTDVEGVNPVETKPESELPSPAEFIAKAMKDRGWSQVVLAYVLGIDVSGVSAILNNRRGISADMAKALAVAFNIPAVEVAQIQAAWDLKRAKEPDESVFARAAMQGEYPLREMIKRGWLREEGSGVPPLSEQLCSFFGVRSIKEVPHLPHAAKRTGYEHVPPAQLAWLFRVKKIASEMIAPAYSATKLQQALEQMQLMLSAPEEVRHVPRLLREAGVRFVIVEALPGSRIDGVCFWLDKVSPVIGMSLRFDRIDNFWFVLRHECAHVLHGHGQQVAMIDADVEQVNDAVAVEERVANSDAAEFCIPQEKMRSFYLRKNPFFSERDVLAFAKIMKIHPGLVVGQLQRLAGRYDLLKRHLVNVRSHILGSALVDGWGDVVPVT